MDPEKIGSLIRRLRTEGGMTQLQLAERLNVSDKAVSKWERGLGCPELSLLPALSALFGVDLEKLLSGELDANERQGGNVKKIRFAVCPVCGNVVAAMADTGLTCCGRRLKLLSPRRAAEGVRLRVETVENEFFVTSDHPMERGHYVSFVALLTGDSLVLRKLYPEWDLQTRIPVFAHGTLVWYCTRHGLFSMEV